MNIVYAVGVIGCSVLLSVAQSKPLGVVGPVFTVAEIDMLQWIETRLQDLTASGQLAQMQCTFQERVKARCQRPVPVPNVTTTTQPKSFYVDPTLTLQADIHDHQGALLYPKGLRINPFDDATWPDGLSKQKLSFNKQLIFINGDDSRQLAWFKAYQKMHSSPLKLILVQGEPVVTHERLAAAVSTVYFDQLGNLTCRLSIQAVPAVVSQEQTRWKVQEYDVSSFTPLPPDVGKSDPL